MTTPPYPNYPRPGSRLRLITLLIMAVGATALYYEMPVIIQHFFGSQRAAAVKTRPPGMQFVPVASHALAAYTKITAKDIRMVAHPKEKPLSEGTILTLKELVGKVTRVPIAAKQAIVGQDLMPVA